MLTKLPFPLRVTPNYFFQMMDGLRIANNGNPMIYKPGSPTESPEAMINGRKVSIDEADDGSLDPIPQISNSLALALEEISVITDNLSPKPRAKYIRPADHAVFQKNSHVNNIPLNSGTPSGEGIGGEGGSDGRGKKDDNHPDDVIQFSLDTAGEKVISAQNDQADEESSGSREDVRKNETHDAKLAVWAEVNGVEYVEPSGYEDVHNTFVRKKFFKHATRKSKIEEVRERLNDDITAIRMFKVNIKSALSRATRESFEDEKKNILDEDGIIRLPRKQRRNFAAVLTRAFEMMKGSMPQSSRALILKELEEIRKMVEELPKSYSREKEMRIMDAASLMEGVFRYKMEGREGTYRSINLTPETLAQLCNVSDVDKILFKDEDNLSRIVDYGCGDGETLIQIASKLPYSLALKGIQKSASIVRQSIFNVYGDNTPSYWVGVEIEKQATPVVEKWKNGIAEQVKDRFVCIDQAPHFIERLKDRKGLGGVTADLCVPTADFHDTTGIAPGSVDIGISSLTIDRARDIGQLLANISATLAEDGTLVLLTKSTHAAQSDGSAAADRFSQIEYGGQAGLKAKDRFQLLELMKGLLEENGLKIERVGRHPGKVISTDVSGNQVQSYNLLAIVCKKIRNEDGADRRAKAVNAD